MNPIYKILEYVQTTTTECVLATIIHVKGSAYLREDTSMLIKKDGTCLGIISAGCIESDIIQHAQKVFESKKAKTIVYNMESTAELEWGVGTGCKGTIYILLEYVDQNLKDHLIYIKDHINIGKVIIYQRLLNENWDLMERFFVTENSLQEELSDISSLKQTNANHIYTQKFTSKPRLIIFGAGLDVKPVVSLAKQTGFLVIVCDWRPALCNENNIPEAEKYIIGFPNEIVNQLSFKKDDYVIIMTHNFKRDKEILSLIKDKSLLYIGVLGSRERTAYLFDNEIPTHIHAPIGLEIGAKGPFEIAISIVAELIHTKKSKTQA